MIITFKNLPDYRIVVERYNHTLQHCVVVPEINERTGKPNKNPGPAWREVGFYPNVGQACNGLIKHAMLTTEDELEIYGWKQWYENMVNHVEEIKYVQPEIS